MGYGAAVRIELLVGVSPELEGVADFMGMNSSGRGEPQPASWTIRSLDTEARCLGIRGRYFAMEYLILLAVGIVVAIFLVEPATDPHLDECHHQDPDKDTKWAIKERTPLVLTRHVCFLAGDGTPGRGGRGVQMRQERKGGLSGHPVQTRGLS